MVSPTDQEVTTIAKIVYFSQFKRGGMLCDRDYTGKHCACPQAEEGRGTMGMGLYFVVFVGKNG